MYNVLDICRYVINYSNKHDYGVSNLKLQKLLYFIQVYFLINSKNQEPCFYEDIRAWNFGPVVPEAYHEYKQFGSSDIPSINSYIDFNEREPWDSPILIFNENCIRNEDKKLINTVINDLSDYSATDLVSITHNQAPWKNAYNRKKNSVITIEAIRKYFNEK